jgi:hypothetical protein
MLFSGLHSLHFIFLTWRTQLFLCWAISCFDWIHIENLTFYLYNFSDIVWPLIKALPHKILVYRKMEVKNISSRFFCPLSEHHLFPPCQMILFVTKWNKTFSLLFKIKFLTQKLHPTNQYYYTEFQTVIDY